MRDGREEYFFPGVKCLITEVCGNARRWEFFSLFRNKLMLLLFIKNMQSLWFCFPTDEGDQFNQRNARY